MKCEFHPNDDALYECTSCGKPICGQCMRFDDDDRVVCPACTLEKAVEVADKYWTKYLRKGSPIGDRLVPAAALWEKIAATVDLRYVAIAAVLGVLQMLMRMYVGGASPPASYDVDRFRQRGDPGAEMSYILARLFQYANDHNGVYPDTVTALYPNYLESRPKVLGSEDSYLYFPITGPEQFLLSLPLPRGHGYRRLDVNGDGVLLVK